MIKKLAETLHEKKDLIDKWFSKQKVTWPIYGSFDIRNAGFKAVVVDSNVFPGGWNNTNDKCADYASENFYSYINNLVPDAKNIALMAEDTTNPYYYENIKKLKDILSDAGFEVLLFLSNFESGERKTTKEFLDFKKARIEDGKLFVSDVKPDFIINNDDLSITDIKLINDIEQPIMPPTHLGWNTRTKQEHFDFKKKVVKEICSELDLDPWLFGSYHDFEKNVNFKEKTNLEKISDNIDNMIVKIQKKYDEYGIKETPYVFVKGSSSTYGMNALAFHSGKEFLEINSEKRRKMHKAKGGKIVTSVIIQEGVPSNVKVNGEVAEPVIYAVGNKAVGIFYRTHPTKGTKDNLSARGMYFVKESDCFKRRTTPELEVYAFLARLGMQAIANEMAFYNR